MFEMFFYFLFAYSLVLTFLFYCGCRLQSRHARPDSFWRNWTPKHIILATFTVLLLPTLPYRIVELNTALALPSVLPALRQEMNTEYAGDARILAIKVLLWTPMHEDIYVIVQSTVDDKPCTVGELYTRELDHDGWNWVGGPNAAWSDCGSASGNVFPPYPAKGEW